MRIDIVAHWMGSELPEKFRGEGPFEVAPEEFVALSATYDVALMHERQPMPTRRQQQAGVRQAPDQVLLALDHPGGRFRQR